MTAALDRHLYLRILLDLLWYGPKEIGSDWREQLRFGGGMVTDAKSLYDHMITTGLVPKERQTMLDLLVCKDMLGAKAYDLHWVPTHRQYADALTKRKRDELWEAFCQYHQVSLKETVAEKAVEDHRRSLRKDQRQRRKQRFGSAVANSRTDQRSFPGM